MNKSELDMLLKVLEGIDFERILLAADKLVCLIDLFYRIKGRDVVDNKIIQEDIDKAFRSYSNSNEECCLDENIGFINEVVGFIVCLEFIRDCQRKGDSNDDDRIKRAFSNFLSSGSSDKATDKQEKLKEAIRSMPGNDWF